ncbi:purine nucleoside permease [Opitutia bacterium ISCC 51]|nr:purine nucleoside permease [Opitutae bacterium ISCC 51]QXD27309.1 purine nucleoside permease [Opitutae bacterium ISCC 52]
MNLLRWSFFFLSFLGCLSLTAQAADPIPIKVVVLTMFEHEGERPGERQFWIERLNLDQRLPFPAGRSDIYTNGDGLLLITTGMGVSNAAASVMALGMDSRFDFSNTYWLVAGICGIDPHDGSMGSAVWTDYVIDGGLAHEIDAREIPDDWTTGYTPLRSPRPFDRNGEPVNPSQLFKLNPGLMQWAYQLTKDVPLKDRPELEHRRAEFVGFPNAQKKPFVLIGSHLADSTFWHGEKMTQFGNDWTSFWTEGKGNFVTKAMEDSGTLQALKNLDNAGKVDYDRVMILRTAANYTMPSPGMTAYESLARERGASLSAFIESLEAAFSLGNTVVQELLTNWEKYEDKIPTR